MDEFNCALCNNRLNDPRVLQCGDTLCNDCIKNILKNNPESFECPICNKLNICDISKAQEFPKNKLIVELMVKNSKKFYTDEYSTLLNKHINDIFERIKDFKKQVKLIKGRNQDYYDFSYRSNKAINSIIKSIQSSTNKLLYEQLDEFKNVIHADKIDSFKANIRKCLNELNTFQEKWNGLAKDMPQQNEFVEASNNINESLCVFEIELSRLVESLRHSLYDKIQI
jgi:hypothetical protein